MPIRCTHTLPRPPGSPATPSPSHTFPTPQVTKAEPTDKSQKKKRKVAQTMSGQLYGEGHSESSESEGEGVNPLTKEEQHEAYKKEAKSKLRAWRAVDVDWREEFPMHPFASPTDIDLMELMDVDVGMLYLKFQASANPAFGYIPVMASSSYGQIGVHHPTPPCHANHHTLAGPTIHSRLCTAPSATHHTCPSHGCPEQVP